MALQQVVNILPSTPACIKWSKDYELAIAAGEQVVVMVSLASFGRSALSANA